ncbi:hypothetical protein LTR36_007871 [Oleoguttula mirabilis]|uniref:Uncharacterized protein n=1 Tax=Oleoguttula mirabilis TaxID=1507867 RepID=A0AAV9J9C0_9PEZI|nr:hypothetical protein LTR36_007871 [Oleoguttula mirabilis]
MADTTANTSPTFVAGSLIQFTQTAPGQYEAKQVQQPTGLPDTLFDSKTPINWTEGPVSISGWIDLSSLNVTLNVSVMGMALGTVVGDLHQGIILTVNLMLEKGSLTFHLGSGNELMVKVALDGIYNWSDDINILKL